MPNRIQCNTQFKQICLLKMVMYGIDFKRIGYEGKGEMKESFWI